MSFLKNLKDRVVSAGRSVGKTLGLIPNAKVAPKMGRRHNPTFTNEQLLARLQSHLNAHGTLATIRKDHKRWTAGMTRSAAAQRRKAIADLGQQRVLVLPAIRRIQRAAANIAASQA